MSTVTQTISGTSTRGAEVRSRAGKAQDSITMSPRKGLARIAGFLWLVVGISGGFAQGFMEPKMYAAGNAAATAANVVANPGLVRLGVVAELVDSTVFIFLAMTLYILLNHVHKSVARAMVDLVAMFLVPDLGQKIGSFIIIPSAIAEITMLAYLLVFGVRVSKPDKNILAAA